MAAAADGADGVIVKVSGALKGVVRVASYESPVSELRACVARLLGVPEAAGGIKLIAGGRTLQDDTKPLSQYNVGPATRVLVTRGAAAALALAGEEEAQRLEEARLAQLERLRATVDRMARRGDGRGLTDRYEFSLENQDGSRLHLTEADRQALVLGLALHEKGRASLGKGNVQDALDELLLAEESFGVVTPSFLESVDNVAMLLLDIVWCYYKLRDISRLGVCGERLASARRMLERAHGPRQERLRLLHGNFSPELTTYVRLELLEGIVAFHSGEQQAALQRLQSAQARWQKLQLSEDALLQLAELGYGTRRSSRALRFSGGDVAAAVEFLAAQQEKEQERRAKRRKRSAWLKNRMQYGKTASGKFVDQDSLEQLAQLGYDSTVAAEALRQNENDANASLDDLTDLGKRAALQLAVATRKVVEQDCGPQWVSAAHVQRLRDMGFREQPARQALAAAGDKVARALQRLQDMGPEAREFPEADAADAAAGGAGQRSEGPAGGAGPSREAAAPGGADGNKEDMDVDGSGSDHGSGSSSADEELEAELVATVAGKDKDDPLAAYDIDVGEDGEAILLYLSLLAAPGAGAGQAGAGAGAGGTA